MAKYAVSIKPIDKKPITDSLASFNKVIANKEYAKLQAYSDSLTKRVEELGVKFPAIKTVADEIAKQKPAPAQSAPNVANINNAAMNSRVMSRQDPQAYQFNKPSDYYISNNRKYSVQEKKQFEFLDNINLLLDTSITLYNQGKTVAASSYIERVFFNEML